MRDHRIEGSVLCTKREAKLRFREGILQSWRWCCAYCGAPAGTLDHVRAKRRGGPTVVANLVAACSGCNQAKGSADWVPWFRQQVFWSRAREEAIALWLRWGSWGSNPPQADYESAAFTRLLDPLT